MIGDHLAAFINDQMREGRYASANEPVRDGLRTLEDREKLRSIKLEALRGEIERGKQGGASAPAKTPFVAEQNRVAQPPASRTDG